MNNVCLCVGNYAKTPYYVKISDISLYSIEELCYYFMDKVYLLDDSIVSAELVRWIKLECGLTELAEELEIFVRKRMSAASFVTTILERTNMYDESTIKRIEQILKEQANLSSTDRYRKQAEYLYKQGRYRQALIIYSELLDYLPKRDNLARAQLYYNIATIYAMDFAYNKAADFYYESYRLYPDRQARLAYILACRRSGNRGTVCSCGGAVAYIKGESNAVRVVYISGSGADRRILSNGRRASAAAKA